MRDSCTSGFLLTSFSYASFSYTSLMIEQGMLISVSNLPFFHLRVEMGFHLLLVVGMFLLQEQLGLGTDPSCLACRSHTSQGHCTVVVSLFVDGIR